MASRFRKPHIGKQPMKFYVTCQVRLSPLARGLRGPRPRSDTAAAPKRQPASLHRPSCSPCACTTPAGALPALNPTPNPHGARTSAVPTQPAAGHVPRPAEAARRGGHRLAPRAQSRDGAHGPPLALPAPQPTPSARRGARRAQVRPDARARRTADSPSRTRPRHRPAACFPPPPRAEQAGQGAGGAQPSGRQPLLHRLLSRPGPLAALHPLPRCAFLLRWLWLCCASFPLRTRHSRPLRTRHSRPLHPRTRHSRPLPTPPLASPNPQTRGVIPTSQSPASLCSPRCGTRAPRPSSSPSATSTSRSTPRSTRRPPASRCRCRRAARSARCGSRSSHAGCGHSRRAARATTAARRSTRG